MAINLLRINSFGGEKIPIFIAFKWLFRFRFYFHCDLIACVRALFENFSNLLRQIDHTKVFILFGFITLTYNTFNS